MTLQRYLILIIAGTVLSYAMLATVLFLFNPFTSGALGIVAFYVSAGLAATGTLAVIGLVSRVLFTRNTVMFKMVLDSFRQAILFSVLLLASLTLFKYQLLTWMNALLLVLMLTLLESYFITRRQKSV